MMFFKEIFYLQKSDRKAVLSILCVIVIALLIIFLAGNDSVETLNTSSDTSSVQSNHQYNFANSNQPGNYYQVDGRTVELFEFDPNTADSTQLLRLGFAPFQVKNIYRYRAKGGIYRKPEDLAKLYGMSKKQYEMLLPYVRISDDYRPASDFYGSSYSENKRDVDSARMASQTYHYPQKLKMGQKISVNNADTTELQKIPGIGSGYARAIIRYRERLGGFSNASQLLEIEGVPNSSVVYIAIDASLIHKLNINKLSLNQLRHHPYINFYQAREICDYRRLKGPLKSLSDLKLLNDFPPAEIERLAPYVEF